MKTNVSSRSRRRLLICVGVLIGAVILLIATEWGAWAGLRSSSAAPAPSAPSAGTIAVLETSVVPAVPSNPGITGGPTPVRAFGAAPLPPPPPEGARSPLADRLNDRALTARDDVVAVAEIFANYLEAMHELPVGTNAEITAALAGDNPRAHTPLPADSGAISSGGELVDRWGTPYFFHQVSRELTEIRSAGPDHRHFTPDDIVWPGNGGAPSPWLARTGP